MMLYFSLLRRVFSPLSVLLLCGRVLAQALYLLAGRYSYRITFSQLQSGFVIGILLPFIFSCFFQSSLTAQCSVYPVSLAQRVSEATCIIEGVIIEKHCVRDNSTQRIYTLNKVEVHKVFKGEHIADTIGFLTSGGFLDGINEKVSPSLSLALGDCGVFLGKPFVRSKFLELKAELVFEVVADQQGFIRYNTNKTIARDVFHSYTSIETEVYQQLEKLTTNSVRSVKDFVPLYKKAKSSALQATPIITGFSPKSLSAGTKSVLTITGSGFGSRINKQLIFFADADEEEGYLIAPIDEEYLLWSDTQIQVYVPERAGTGTISFADANTNVLARSRDTLQVRFARSTDNLVPRNEYDLVNHNNKGGFTWQFSQEFNTNTDAKNAFITAMNRWKCATGVNWEVGAVTSVNTVASDNINIVRFANEGELPTGVLGRCETQSRLCGTNNNINYVTGLDISFRRNSVWNFSSTQMPDSSQHDFESVALHELGHAHQLNHVIDESDVMHFSIPKGKVGRGFTANNLEGSSYIMRQAIVTNSCGSSAMLRAASSATCPPLLVQPTNKSSIVNNSGSTMQLVWTQVLGATSYNLQITSNSVFAAGSGFFLDTNVNALSASLPLDRLSNRRHFWRVRANYSSSASDFSGVFDFVIKGASPTALANVSQLTFPPLESGVAAFQSIQFSNPANASGSIRVEITVQPTNGTPRQVITVDGTSSTFTLQPGQTASVPVRFAPNAAAQFIANLLVVDRATGLQIATIPVTGTGIVNVQPLSAIPTLLVPTNGSSLSFSNRTVSFSWQAVANATSYRVVVSTLRSGEQSGANVWSFDTTTARTSLTVTLPERTPFYWRVQARNSTTQSSFSADFTLNFFRDTTSTTPTLTTLSNISPQSLQASWQLDRSTPRDSGFVHGTNLYLHRAKATALRLPAGQRQALLSQVAVWFAYKRPGLTNQTYRVEVYSGTAQTGPQSLLASRDYILAGVASGNSDMVNISLPVIPTLHSFTPAVTVGESFFIGVNFGQYGVSGISDAGIASTDFLGRRVAEDWEMSLDGRWVNMSDTWFPASQPNGWNMWLAAGILQTTTSVKEEVALFQLSHYPNPCNEFTTIQYTLPQAAHVELELFTLLGARVATIVSEQQGTGNYVVPVDVRHYSSGQYFYRLRVNGEQVTRALQVIR